MSAGVYAIVNSINHKAYIGSSSNLRLRLRNHKCAINTKTFRHNEPYASDAVKYGIDAFEFKVLCLTNTVEEARELETACLQCFAGDGLYNRALHADGASGLKRDPKKYIEGAKKRLSNPSFRKSLSDACKGKREVVECPYCGLSGGGGNMRRYHFDKCASKK